MPFGMLTRVGLRNHVTDKIHMDATWRVRLSDPCSAAIATITGCAVMRAVCLKSKIAAGRRHENGKKSRYLKNSWNDVGGIWFADA